MIQTLLRDQRLMLGALGCAALFIILAITCALLSSSASAAKSALKAEQEARKQ
jgi:hypothetical protein